MKPDQDILGTARPQSATIRSWLSSSHHFWPVRLIVYLGALLLIVVLTKLASLPLVPAPSSPTYEKVVTVRNLLQALAMIAVYTYLVRKLEHRNADETALRGSFISLLTGVVMGIGLIAITFLVLYGLGIAKFQPGVGLSGIATAILKPAVIGTLEELVFRVILFRILQHMSGTLIAVAVSSTLFGIAHWGNPGATPFAIAFLSIEMGVLLALLFVLTRSLWMVAGSHMGWNFALGSVFGSDVSGLETSSSILATTLQGPDLLTGGAFGLEGSIVTLGISLVAILITARLIVLRNLWMPAKIELRER
jgi:uncharacterized protein